MLLALLGLLLIIPAALHEPILRSSSSTGKQGS